MKLLASLAIVIVTQMSLADTCLKSGAFVTLNSGSASDLIALLETISSMPLQGRVVFDDGDLAIVEAIIPEEYALANGLDSFDAARRVADTVKFFDWGVKHVSAELCFDDAQAEKTNAGTVGH